MIYHNLDELYAAKDLAFKKLQQDIQGLTTREANFRPFNDGWSIAEIAEHLSIVERQLLQLITILLTKATEADRSPSAKTPHEISLQTIVERSRTEKYKTRDKFVPSGTIPISDSLHQLSTFQTQLYELKPQLQSVDLTSATFPHWTFGPLNLGQWLAFITFHEERHLVQIQSILASKEFASIGK